MAIHALKLEIFEAWYDYDHASSEDEKGSHKAKRNRLVSDLLQGNSLPVSVSSFLVSFFDDYKEWMRSEGCSRGGGRRF